MKVLPFVSINHDMTSNLLPALYCLLSISLIRVDRLGISFDHLSSCWILNLLTLLGMLLFMKGRTVEVEMTFVEIRK